MSSNKCWGELSSFAVLPLGLIIAQRLFLKRRFTPESCRPELRGSAWGPHSLAPRSVAHDLAPPASAGKTRGAPTPRLTRTCAAGLGGNDTPGCLHSRAPSSVVLSGTVVWWLLGIRPLVSRGRAEGAVGTRLCKTRFRPATLASQGFLICGFCPVAAF